MKPTTFSLFCGGGGESAGKHLAFEELGIETKDMSAFALNHWNLAVACHGRNFPWISVHQEDITAVTAADFGLERINLLWASPSCVHHSRARGGKPKEDQQRSHAWEVVDRWLRVAHVDVLMIENVPEFSDWGPLDDEGQPIKERKGEFFQAFLADLRSLGYQMEWRVLCAADYGDPTIRKRFFLQAVRDGLPIVWPEPSHRNPKAGPGLFDADLPPWRAAAECIDWSIPCPSIFDRKKPLADATLRRIAAGVMRYVVNSSKPFLVNLTHGGRLEDLEEPFKTITGANRGEKALCTPYLVNMRGTDPSQIEASASGADEPVRTVSAGGRHQALIVPSFAGLGGRAAQSRPRGGGEPFGTLTTKADGALIAASLVQTGYGEREGQAPRTLDIEKPLGTVVAEGQKHALVAGFLAKHFTGVVGQEMEKPLGTVTAVDHHSKVAVHLTKFQQNSIGQDADDPLHTVMAGAPRFGLVAAFLAQYYSSGGQSGAADAPMGAITTVDRHALVTVTLDGQEYVLADIGMRMLEPHELAAAMGFPDWFRFQDMEGKPFTKRDTVKMIGNACPVNTVKALVKAVVLQRRGAYGLLKEPA